MRRFLEELLGSEVRALYRIHFSDKTIDQEYTALNALVMEFSNSSRFELLTSHTNTVLLRLGDSQGLYLGDVDGPTEPADPDEELTLCTLTGAGLDRSPSLPIAIHSATEFWTGDGEKDYLVAVSLADASQIRRLDLCTESDEIEVMTPEQLSARLIEIRRRCPRLVEYHYQRRAV